MQKLSSEGIFVERQELRVPVLHQILFVYKLEKRNYPPESRQCEVKRRFTITVAESPSREYSDPCSYESNSDYKQFGEQKKSGIGAAIVGRRQS